MNFMTGEPLFDFLSRKRRCRCNNWIWCRQSWKQLLRLVFRLYHDTTAFDQEESWRESTDLTSGLALLLLLSADPLLLGPLSATFLLWAEPGPGQTDTKIQGAFAFRSGSDSLTILSFRAISSSSSFFLHSKWASMRACSSIRSLFWRFFWMSCRGRHSSCHR